MTMNRLYLTFFNVGYGEAMLLQLSDPTCQSGAFVLLLDGGGNDPEEFANSDTGRRPLLSHLQAAGIDHIDAVIVSHLHEDHVSGLLPVVRAFPPKAVYQTLSPDFCLHTMRPLDDAAAKTVSLQKFTKSLNDFHALCATTVRHGGAIRRIAAGDVLALPDGLKAAVLAPSPARSDTLESDLSALYRTADGNIPDQTLLSRLDGGMNNFSAVIRLDYGKTRLLLPGDTNRAGFGGIEPRSLRADLYKVGHHGQIDGADAALLDAIRPNAVVCCASSDRRYNSAHPDLLRMIAERGAALYFSDCPPNPFGDPIPMHERLCFAIGQDQTIEATYR